MKRKITTLLLAAVMLMVLSAPAVADVMWEPYGNSFYESHREEMEYVDRGYLANGQDGYITIKAAPDSLVEVANLPNGTYFNVGMTWQGKDGTLWAVGYHIYQTESGWNEYMGWVPMSELALIYDYKEFASDHSGEFEAYDGSGDDLTEVCLYSYPGGTYKYNLKESKDYMPFAESFEHLYTDENGLRWTYVGYYMGRNNAWVCIDDPLNETLGTAGYLSVGQVRSGADVVPPAKELPQTGEKAPSADPSEDGEELIPPAKDIPAARTWVVWAIPAALIAVVAVATAVLIRKKRKTA